MSEPLRPVIKIPLTATDKIIEMIGVTVLVVFWLYIIANFSQLPEIIPTHFGAEGKPDGYGPKWMIILLPVIGTILYVALTIFSRFPHKFNYNVTISEANAEKQYKTVTKMLRIMKIMVLLTFFLLNYQTVQIALGLPDQFGRWFLLMVLALVFVPLFYFLIQTSKNS